MTSITIREGVTSIGGSAFKNCTSLESITIPDSVTSIGGGAFSGCSNLPIIGGIRYADCCITEIVDKTLDSYTFKENTRFIQANFYECRNLISIDIPNGIIFSIGDRCFEGCTSLTSVTIGNGVDYIGNNAFRRCRNLTNVTIGESVTSIGDYAFYGCMLAGINIPDSVITIGVNAFQTYGPDVIITIGKGVTSIGYDALDCCWKSLYIKAITPPAGLSTSFQYNHPYEMYELFGIETNIYVPRESYDAYITSISSIFDNHTNIDGYIIPYDFE